MSVITDAWLAGSTRRWHATWYMSNVDDSVSAHSARVAGLILQFSASPSAALLAHAITHDDGEQGVFDIPGPIKKRLSHETKGELDAIERDAFDYLWNDHPTLSKCLTDDESQLLKMCDMLDAYLMVKRYATDRLSVDGWPETKKEILEMAGNLSLYGEVVGVMGVVKSMVGRTPANDIYATHTGVVNARNGWGSMPYSSRWNPGFFWARNAKFSRFFKGVVRVGFGAVY